LASPAGGYNPSLVISLVGSPTLGPGPGQDQDRPGQGPGPGPGQALAQARPGPGPGRPDACLKGTPRQVLLGTHDPRKMQARNAEIRTDHQPELAGPDLAFYGKT
jgi:hypothetical protein